MLLLAVFCKAISGFSKLLNHFELCYYCLKWLYHCSWYFNARLHAIVTDSTLFLSGSVQGSCVQDLSDDELCIIVRLGSRPKSSDDQDLGPDSPWHKLYDFGIAIVKIKSTIISKLGHYHLDDVWFNEIHVQKRIF